MPVREAIICSLCGGKYFRASLPHHQKVCARRHGVNLWTCEFCAQPIPEIEKDVHLRFRCAEVPKNVVSEITEADPETKESDYDGRVPCVYCTRKFNKDRLEKHMSICEKQAIRGCRSKFDSAAQRRVEDEYAELPPRPSAKSVVRKKLKEPSKDEAPKIKQPIRKRVDEEMPQLKSSQRRTPPPVAVSVPSSSVKKLPKNSTGDPFKTSGGTFQNASRNFSSSSNGGGRLGNLKPKILPSNATSADNPLATGWQY